MNPGDKTDLEPGAICMNPPMIVNDQGIWERIYYPGEWISVKDRLPEEDKCVLLYSDMFAEGFVVGRLIDKETGWICGKFRILPKKVTHWIEIPELPKEK